MVISLKKEAKRSYSVVILGTCSLKISPKPTVCTISVVEKLSLSQELPHFRKSGKFLKKYRAEAKWVCKPARLNSWHNYVTHFSPKIPSKSAMEKKRQFHTITALHSNNTILTDPAEISEKFATHLPYTSGDTCLPPAAIAAKCRHNSR